MRDFIKNQTNFIYRMLSILLYTSTSTRLLDCRFCRFWVGISSNLHRRTNFSTAKNLEEFSLRSDDASLVEDRVVDFCYTSLCECLDLIEIHCHILDWSIGCESSLLRSTTEEWSLSSLECCISLASSSRVLTIHTSSRGTSESRTRSASHSSWTCLGTWIWLKWREICHKKYVRVL